MTATAGYVPMRVASLAVLRTKTAPYGVLAKLDSGVVYIQNGPGVDDVWVLVGPVPGVGSYVPVKVAVNPGPPGSYERV